MIQSAFDALAEQYDALWSETAIGRNQRAAVWQRVDPLFQSGERILDVGCGNGTDARHFLARGVKVLGIDASAEMVRVARSRGVDAQRLAIERMEELPGCFDGAVSNFGALNCVRDLDQVARELGRLVRPGGYAAVCVVGRCCLWEVAYCLRRLRPGKALRRWHSGGSQASLGIRVYYPSVRALSRAFRRDFRLTGWYGIGLFVPPSYVRGISEAGVARLAEVDRRFAQLPVFRALADHRLLVFQRL